MNCMILILHYGSKVAITEEHHQSQAVYSSQISMADATNTAARYKEILKNNELIDSPEISNKKLFDGVAEIVKGDIKDCNGITIHPLDPSDISFKNIEGLVPITLSELLISMWEKQKNVLNCTRQ